MKTQPKLIITVGLPASGKSTWAEAHVPTEGRVKRVVTRDDIRAAVQAEHDAGDEHLVVQVRDAALDFYLSKGYEVVCADTNMTPRGRKRLVEIAHRHGAVVEFVVFSASLHTCLTRNADRIKRGDVKVPQEAIERMWENDVMTGKYLQGLPVECNIEVSW